MNITFHHPTGGTVSINIANLTHITPGLGANSNIHMVGGAVISVAGTVAQVEARLNNKQAVAA